MSTVYLKDGSRATLVSTIEDGFLVRRHILCQCHGEDEEYEDESDVVEIVPAVFSKAPTHLIESDYKTALLRLEVQTNLVAEKKEEWMNLQKEVNQLKSQKTDLSRYIINREELRTAKRLILFVNGQIQPRVMDGKSSHKFTVSYEISQYKGEERVWAYKLWWENKDNAWSNSEYFDEQYGIKVDLSDDEIKALALERLSKKKVSDIHESYLLSCPDEWLLPEWVQAKREKQERKDRQELQAAEKALSEAQARVDKLSKKELTVS